MKRARLRKEKPVSPFPGEAADSLSAQSELPHPGMNRRTRTSAAMIGLALSMGTTSLLLPRHNDGAAAAEPKAPDTISAAFSDTAPESDSQSSAPIPTVRMVEHMVQEGQTLQQLADRYQVNVWSIAVANGLTPNSELMVGQVLKVPVRGELSPAQAVAIESLVGGSESGDLVASAHLNQVEMNGPVAASESLGTDRNDALNRLRQQRDRLRDSLAELRGEESEPAVNVLKRDFTDSSRSVVASTLGSVVLEASSEQSTLAALPTQSLSGEAVSATQDTDSVQVARVSATQDDEAAVPSLPVGATTAQVYRVNPGDTVAAIARSHNIPQSLLIDANNLSDPNVIFVGQTLTVPAIQPTSPASPVQVASETLSAAILPAIPTGGTAPGLSTVDTSNTVTTETVNTEAPAVPSLLAQSTSESLPHPIASPTVQQPRPQIAVAPLPEASVGPLGVDSEPGLMMESNPGSQVNPYVASLLSEIKTLRQRNQPATVSEAQSVPAQEPPERAAAVVSPSSASEVAVSPHFNPAAVERQVGETRPISNATQTTPASPNLVAAAPLGSESYDPLLQPITGRMVSPDLPPLPGADTFLPEDGLFNGYIWPSTGLLTSGYGWRWGRMHQGIDIAADIGTPIYAAATGVIEFAGWNSGGYGNMVEVRHPDGSMTRYAHMNAVYVRVGQAVRQGEQLGEMGSTGYSTGPHLHFEVHLPNQGTVNPIAYLPPQ
ncbi:peptidoglycan DD-metalloendopeptidase family protein [Thermocoleostomius sinensis]|uniref:Peptidoglycan DD-metalloendopeptidase family protein n=1 Tax=Thermocoleostomius sinensis A174 TaxID=2016057 RepID=A0A9E8ZDA8_9CYAN|nr:peptidoglycan DD-metalloendopeptidase family protein [Thermocoleostomius sinensis]WAL61179.1 peptidoglycan DD-metalloendopeptidase family protein [Thermocoleostomius sinensis A174]